jgi:hypothetical protein
MVEIRARRRKFKLLHGPGVAEEDEGLEGCEGGTSGEGAGGPAWEEKEPVEWKTEPAGARMRGVGAVRGREGGQGPEEEEGGEVAGEEGPVVAEEGREEGQAPPYPGPSLRSQTLREMGQTGGKTRSRCGPFPFPPSLPPLHNVSLQALLFLHLRLNRHQIQTKPTQKHLQRLQQPTHAIPPPLPPSLPPFLAPVRPHLRHGPPCALPPFLLLFFPLSARVVRRVQLSNVVVQ